MDDIVYENEDKKAKKGDTDTSDFVVDEESEAPEILVKKLKEKIKILEKEKQENMDGWQRERGDTSTNFKKRTENEKIEVVKYANERLVEELLPVLDSFEMAFANKVAWEQVDKNWRIGVEYIHSQLVKALDDNGLTEMNPVEKSLIQHFMCRHNHARYGTGYSHDREPDV